MAQATSTNWRTFLAIWFAQTTTELGSDLSSFALAVWVYQQSESAALYSFLALAGILPQILVWPVAGALIDRWDRRKTLMLGEFCAALCMGAALFLAMTGALRVWHAFVITCTVAISRSLSYPALSAVTPLLVSPSELGRANGLVEIGQAGSQLLSPALAGILLTTVGIEAVIGINMTALAVSLTILSMVRLLRPTPSVNPTFKPSLRTDLLLAWRYIKSRPALSLLTRLHAASMFIMGVIGVLLTPLILTISTVAALGIIHFVGGLGMLGGGLLMLVWGGPRRRALGIITCVAAQGLTLLILGGITPSEIRIAAGAFAFLGAMAILNGCNQTLWQTVVPADLQGRVLSLRTTLTWATLPLAYVLAGPLAEGVFEPLLASSGPLAGTVGGMIGVGPGRGIAFLFMLLGAVLLLLAVTTLTRQEVRGFEERGA